MISNNFHVSGVSGSILRSHLFLSAVTIPTKGMICDETFVAIAEAAVLKDLDFVKKATVQKKTKRCSAHSSQNDCGT